MIFPCPALFADGCTSSVRNLIKLKSETMDNDQILDNRLRNPNTITRATSVVKPKHVHRLHGYTVHQ